MKHPYLDCISVENMRESDRLTIENYVSGRTLMYRAALGVYRAVPSVTVRSFSMAAASKHCFRLLTGTRQLRKR